jgi:ABC-2 type transport system ATP-binding protein
MEGNILTVKSLSKQYSTVKALTDISFVLKSGESLGLLGKNGSGKTTLLNIISGIKKSTSGDFQWSNSPENQLNNEKVGILLEAPAFYPTLNAVDNLKITCLIKKASYSEIESILKEVDLYERRKTDFQNYSLGMKQRLGIASALVGNPKLLILDEPTNGLDPQGISLIRELIIKKKNEGASIILASHILDEVEKTCSKLLVLNSGVIAYKGETKQLLSSENQLELKSEDLKVLKLALKDISIVSNIEDKGTHLLITIPEDFTGTDVSRLLIEKNIILSEIQASKKSLEEELLKLLK